MTLPPTPDRSTAGIVLDPQTLERVVPSSKRTDGTTRKVLKIRPGFTPAEDVSRYRPARVVEAQAARGIVPGSGGRSSASANNRDPYARDQGPNPFKSDTSSPLQIKGRNTAPRELKEVKRTGGLDWDSDDEGVERVEVDEAAEALGGLRIGGKEAGEPLGTGSKAPGGGAPEESVSAIVVVSESQPDSGAPATDPPTAASPTDPTSPPPSFAEPPVGASGLVSPEKTELDWKAASYTPGSRGSGRSEGSRADRDTKWVRGETPPTPPPAQRRTPISSQATRNHSLGTASRAQGGGAPRESVSSAIAHSDRNGAPPLNTFPTSSAHTDPLPPAPSFTEEPVGASGLVSPEKTEREWKAASYTPSSRSSGRSEGSRADRDTKWVRGETPPTPPPAQRRTPIPGRAPRDPPLGMGSKAPGGGAPEESISASVASSDLHTQPTDAPPLTDPPTSSSPTDPVPPPPSFAEPPVGASGLVSPEKTERDWKAAKPPTRDEGSRADRDVKWVRGETPPSPPSSQRRMGQGSGVGYGNGSGMGYGARGTPPSSSSQRRYTPGSGNGHGSAGRDSASGGSYQQRGAGFRTGERASPSPGHQSWDSVGRAPTPRDSPQSQSQSRKPGHQSWESVGRAPTPRDSPQSQSQRRDTPGIGPGSRASPSPGHQSWDSVGRAPTPRDSPQSQSQDRASAGCGPGAGETPPSERVRKEIKIRGGAPGAAGSMADKVRGMLVDTRPAAGARSSVGGEGATS